MKREKMKIDNTVMVLSLRQKMLTHKTAKVMNCQKGSSSLSFIDFIALLLIDIIQLYSSAPKTTHQIRETQTLPVISKIQSVFFWSSVFGSVWSFSVDSFLAFFNLSFNSFLLTAIIVSAELLIHLKRRINKCKTTFDWFYEFSTTPKIPENSWEFK